MILVLLGTQDKPFTRLLEAVEKLNVKTKIIVQAGTTKYESKKMEIFDLISSEELNKLMIESDLIITHGGVGSIIEGLNLNKKIIAAARLKEYSEHVNNHQLEIIKEFKDKGYILELTDFNKLEDLIESSKKFTPNKYKSNNKNFVKLIEDFIDKE